MMDAAEEFLGDDFVVDDFVVDPTDFDEDEWDNMLEQIYDTVITIPNRISGMPKNDIHAEWEKIFDSNGIACSTTRNHCRINSM